GKDGFEVAAELRRAGQFVPILMLTARGRPEDVLRGFESGADDYLAKPFELSVLIARINGLLRRRAWFHLAQNDATAQPNPAAARTRGRQAGGSSEGGPVSEPAAELFVFNGKTIDFGALELRSRDQTVRLTLMEAAV